MMECTVNMYVISSIPVSEPDMRDYEPLSANLSFTQHQLKSCLDIEIVDDCRVEELKERFEVLMHRTPGLLSRIKLDVADSLVNIKDDDRKIFYCILCAASKAVMMI